MDGIPIFQDSDNQPYSGMASTEPIHIKHNAAKQTMIQKGTVNNLIQTTHDATASQIQHLVTAALFWESWIDLWIPDLLPGLAVCGSLRYLIQFLHSLLMDGREQIRSQLGNLQSTLFIQVLPHMYNTPFDGKPQQPIESCVAACQPSQLQCQKFSYIHGILIMSP